MQIMEIQHDIFDDSEARKRPEADLPFVYPGDTVSVVPGSDEKLFPTENIGRVGKVVSVHHSSLSFYLPQCIGVKLADEGGYFQNYLENIKIVERSPETSRLISSGEIVFIDDRIFTNPYHIKAGIPARVMGVYKDGDNELAYTAIRSILSGHFSVKASKATLAMKFIPNTLFKI